VTGFLAGIWLADRSGKEVMALIPSRIFAAACGPLPGSAVLSGLPLERAWAAD
jgi:hypothetical protein